MSTRPGDAGETVGADAGIPPYWRAARLPITLVCMTGPGQRRAAAPRFVDGMPPDIPSEPIRAAVTVAVAVYLIGLGLGVATNSLSGASTLLGTVKSRLYSPWLVPAWLDLAYDYRFTYGLDEDADHEIEVAIHAAAAPPLSLPGARRGERAARWRRLARTIAVGGLDEDGGVVAAGVARGGFAQVGGDDLELRVLRLPHPEQSAVVAADAEQVYTARIRTVGGDVQLIRDEPPGEVAPLATPTPRPPERTP